ncbi:hypothetical protein CHUAL_003508 [Chamberlinius hualienensis]
MPRGDDLCPLGFAPHSIRPTRCKRCFRDYSEHKKKDNDKSPNTSDSESKSSKSSAAEVKPSIKKPQDNVKSQTQISKSSESKIPEEKTETTVTPVRRRRPQPEDTLTVPSPSAAAAAASSSPNGRRRTRQRPGSWSYFDNEKSSTEEDSTLAAGYEASSPSTTRKRSFGSELKPPIFEDSTESTSPDVQFMLHVKTSHLNAQRSKADKEGDDEDMASVAGTETTETTLMYQDSVEDLQSQITTLKNQLAEQTQTTSKPSKDKDSDDVKKLKQRIFELETANEELKDDKHVLQLENKELQDELDKRPSIGTVQKAVIDLQQKLHASEIMVEKLAEENDEYKREIQGLEDEMDEIQDNLREDQASQYMDIKKELEQTAKNCRILQFKLKKVERRSAQIESEKNVVEEQLKTITNSENINVDHIKRIRDLETEVKTSKELTMKLTNELDVLQTKLRRTEAERDTIGLQKGGQKSLPITEQTGRPHSPADDSSQLMRELYDAIEREKDTREQLKFSQEEAKSLRKKLSINEDENEGLLLQIKKMASSAPKGKERHSKEKAADSDSGVSDGAEDQLPWNEIKIQMELLEQEAKVLRKKLGDAEVENEGLNKEIKYLESQLSEKSSTQTSKLPPVMYSSKEVNNDVNLNYFEQRVKLLESESNDLRRKLIEKERENEQLNTELESVTRRRGSRMSGPSMQRSRSLDSDNAQQIDLKRQLQLMEQEVSILRQKSVDMEAENEKLTQENKKLQLKVGAAENGNSAGNKKPGPLTLKLRNKIADLETEIEETKMKLKDVEEENEALRKSKPGIALKLDSGSVSELKSQIQKHEENLKTANKINDTLKKEMEKLKNEMENKITNAEAEKRNLQKELAVLSTNINTQTEKMNKSDDDISDLKKRLLVAERNSEQADRKSKEQSSLASQNLSKKLESVSKELEEEKEQHSQIKKRIDRGELVEFDLLRKAEQEKHKLQKESLEGEKKLAEFNKKIQDLEQASKETNKVHRSLRRELEDAQKELENERWKMKKTEGKLNESSLLHLKEKEDLKKQLSDAQNKIDNDERKLAEEKSRWKQKVESLENELNKSKADLLDAIQRKDYELKSYKEQINTLKAQVSEGQEKLLAASKGLKGGVDELEEKHRKLEANYKKEKEEWMDKEVNWESKIKTEVKRRERMEKDHESEMRDRDEDMLRLKDKIKRLENEMKRMLEQRTDLTGELEERIQRLEKQLTIEKQEYDDLTTKYEMLEEEYLVLKAHKVMEKEQVESNYGVLKRNFDEIDGELKALRETFNVRQDTWIKEKLDLQEKAKELTSKLSRANVSAWDLEKARLKETIEEKQNLLDQAKKENRSFKDEVERLKRQVDDTKKMLDDYTRVKAYGKNISEVENPNLLKEIEDLKSKIQSDEKVHRSEVSAIKMKSEQRMVILQDEIHALHLQNAKFRREKDTFKEMLDGAQKSLADLKSHSVEKERSSHVYAQLEEARQKLDMLRKEKEEVLDKLDLAERNCSKAKTEYMTEKASWEIKMATMQTKINELEETTILQGGKSKIFGVKTKLELAWQKERDEQHRLLTESHKMARDLKQRLLDIEAARDRERLESVRHLDHLRKTMDEKQALLQTQINEQQSDLKELRDAHAKLASTNERIKRQKDRLEWEKDELFMISNETKQLQLQDKITIANVTDELRNLKSMVPTALGEGWDSTTAANRGAQPTKVNDTFKENFKSSLKKISTAVDDLRRLHGQKDEDKIKRNLSFRRAISEDEDESGQTMVTHTSTSTLGRRRDDPLGRWRNPQRVTNYPTSPPSMYISPPNRQHSAYRKTQSLDQSGNIDAISDNVSHGSNTSLASQGLDSAPVPSPRVRRRQRGSVVQQSSIESDISNTSLESLEIGAGGVSSSSDISRVQSVVSEGGRKKGFKEKLKKRLSKAKSIEGTPTADHIRQAGFSVLSPGLGSASSIGSEASESGANKNSKDLKSRISSLFKKSGSKSGSLEKISSGSEVKSQTLNRPLVVGPKVNKDDIKTPGKLTRFGSTGNLNK